MPRRKTSALATLALWMGCQGQLFTLHVDGDDQVTVEQGSLLEQIIGDLGFETFLDMDITASEALIYQGVQPGDIQDVRLDLFEIGAIEPSGADLSFLEDMEIRVGAPGLQDKLLASTHDFPKGQALVSFDIEELNLIDYVVSQSMTLSTDITGHRPDDDTVVEAHFKLAVGVTGQGACNSIHSEDSGG